MKTHTYKIATYQLDDEIEHPMIADLDLSPWELQELNHARRDIAVYAERATSRVARAADRIDLHTSEMSIQNAAQDLAKLATVIARYRALCDGVVHRHAISKDADR